MSIAAPGNQGAAPALSTGDAKFEGVNTGAYVPVFLVGSPTGIASVDDANLAAALSKAVAAGAGKIVLQSSTTAYAISSTHTINLPTISIEGQGSQQSVLAPVAGFTGDVLREQMNPWPGQGQAGSFRGFRIDGLSVTGTATGLHIGDGEGYYLDDVIVQNFSGAGSIGIHVDNVTHWTERMTWTSVTVINCTTCVLFDVNGGTGSWDYCNLEAYLTPSVGQVGVKWQAGGVAVGCHYSFKGNVTGANALWWTGNAGTIETTFDVAMERDANAPVGLQIDAGSTVSGNGLIVLGNGFASDSIVGQFQFTGKILTPTYPFLTSVDYTPPIDPLAMALGYKAWNGNSANVAGNSSPTSQRADVVAVYIPPSTPISNIVLQVETAGVGTPPTAFQVGLVSAQPAGQVKIVAQSANLAASAALTTTGAQSFPLSAPYVTNPNDSLHGLYYVVIFQNGAFGTTNVQFSRGNGSNSGYGIGGRPTFGNIGTGLAALPANGTAVVLSDGAGLGWYVGLT